MQLLPCRACVGWKRLTPCAHLLGQSGGLAALEHRHVLQDVAPLSARLPLPQEGQATVTVLCRR